MTNTKFFDSQLASLVNDNRMKDYGHPADHFRKSALMKAILFDNFRGDQRFRHILEMEVDKLVRLSHSPTHVDSWIDVAGYARTAMLVLDRLEGTNDDEELL